MDKAKGSSIENVTTLTRNYSIIDVDTNVNATQNESDSDDDIDIKSDKSDTIVQTDNENNNNIFYNNITDDNLPNILKQRKRPIINLINIGTALNDRQQNRISLVQQINYLRSNKALIKAAKDAFNNKIPKCNITFFDVLGLNHEFFVCKYI